LINLIESASELSIFFASFQAGMKIGITDISLLAGNTGFGGIKSGYKKISGTILTFAFLSVPTRLCRVCVFLGGTAPYPAFFS